MTALENGCKRHTISKHIKRSLPRGVISKATGPGGDRNPIDHQHAHAYFDEDLFTGRVTQLCSQIGIVKCLV